MNSFILQLKWLKRKILGRRSQGISNLVREPLRKWLFSIATGKLDLKIVTRKELFNGKYNIIQFGSEESIVVSKPHNSSDELPALIAKTIGTFTMDKPFVVEVNNAQLCGSAATGFDENGNILSETITGTPTKSLKSLPTRTLALKSLPSFGTPQIDTACSLVGHSGYFHWLMDSLTRIEGCEYYYEQTGRKPILLINSNPSIWKIESLRLLGYEPGDYIQWNSSRIKFKKLVVPSFRREQDLISPAACCWLRERTVSNLPILMNEEVKFSPRIYISRSKISARQVINEDELLEALTPFGFVSYTLENMSYTDEVRLFSQAEIVVAPHGAGLTNIIFAKNDLIVIDLFGSYGSPCFFFLANALGFHYGYLASDKSFTMERIKSYDGIRVDVPKLRDLVEEMLHTYQPHKMVRATGLSQPLLAD